MAARKAELEQELATHKRFPANTRLEHRPWHTSNSHHSRTTEPHERTTSIMPPKIVYGKKKATAWQQTNFTEFLSLDQDAATSTLKKADGEVQDGSGTDKDAAAKIKETKIEQGAAKDNAGTRREVKTSNGTKKGKRRVRPDPVTTESSSQNTRRQESTPDSLSQALNALILDDGETKQVSTKTDDKDIAKTRGSRDKDTTQARPRSALKDRDGNVAKVSHPHYTKTGTEPRAVIDVPRPISPSKQTHDMPKQKSSTRKQARPKPVKKKLPENDIYRTYAAPLLSDEQSIVSFEEWCTDLINVGATITKIAEASFSEVYRLSVASGADGSQAESVLKVVALKTPPDAPLPCQVSTRKVRGCEGQEARERLERLEKDTYKSNVPDVLSEVRLLQELTDIPGFTVFRDVTILQGRPAPAVATAWKEWNQSRPRGKKSEFPDPSSKKSYDETQLWAVIEMQDAGQDLERLMENGGLTSIWQIWDVFWGVSLSIAKGEESCHFEHRDLHLGNVCVRSGGDLQQPVIRDPLRRKLHFSDLDTTVIDYTLSRAEIQTGKKMDVAYLNLDTDPALFEGDASEEYQYEIYRYCRGVALYGKPLQNAPPPEIVETTTPRRSPRKNTHIRFDQEGLAHDCSPAKQSQGKVSAQQPQPEGVWRQFHPKTNLVWCHFLLHKLLKHMDCHKTAPSQLSRQDLLRNIAGEHDEQKVVKKAAKLYKILQRISELLCPVRLGQEGALSSVKEMVVLALEERWIRVEDVEG